MTDQKRKERSKRLYKTYGITIEQWEKKFKEQNGVCWICQTLPKSGILCTDHRHVPKYKNLPLEDKLKEVRGLLCFMCNTSLHGIEKRKNARFLLQRVNEYFNSFPIKGDK